MPDPLLTEKELEVAFGRARTVAERFNVSLSCQGSFVFLECRDAAGGSMLARIDCEGYPMQPPDVAFLDPAVGKRVDAPGSSDRAHWPKGHGPLQRNGTVGLCLAGTRTYLQAHSDPGFVLSLSELVVTLAMCCQGRARELLGQSGRRKHA